MLFTADHDEPRRTLQKFIDTEINPYVDEWKEAEIFPAHQVFKKMGDLGFLGLCKPEEYGGLGLDYSYSVIWRRNPGAFMRRGADGDRRANRYGDARVARFGSDVPERFLAPAITGEMVACVGVSEPSGGSDVAAIK